MLLRASYGTVLPMCGLVRKRLFIAAAASVLCGSAAACRLERPGFTDSIAQRAAERADRAHAPACGVTDSTVLSAQGIADLRLGVLADSVLRDCHVLGDSVARDAAGRPVRELLVDMIRDTVYAQVTHDTVSQIVARGAGFRTRDGYGAGSTLAQLMHISDLTAATGEGSLFALSPSHCGLSFRLAGPAPVPPSPQSGVKALKHTAGEVRVTEVRIFGCRNSIGAAPGT